MKFWQAVAFLDTDQLLDIARITDDAGFHGIMVSDHLFYPERLASPYPYSPDGSPIWSPSTPWPDPWVLISAMAAVTSRLHFTTNIYVAPPRHPLVIAKAVSTAAVLSHGRVALGVGAGWMREECEVMGTTFDDRGARLDEMIEVLRRLWRGGMQEFHGEHYDFDKLEISPVPSTEIPIYGGGHSPPALRRAAHLDGWIGNAYQPDEALSYVQRLAELRQAAGTLSNPDYEVVIALLAPPDVDLYRRMEDAGVTSMLCAPWMFAPEPAEDKKATGEAAYATSLDAKRRAIEDFADTIIAKM